MWWSSPVATATPAKAVDWWYDEVKHCQGQLPGCSSGKYQASHFTAMIWNDGTKLGCWKNSVGLNVCRYKGGCGNCKQPNWAYQGANCYKNNVKAIKETKQKCTQLVEQCFATQFATLYSVQGEPNELLQQKSFVVAAALLAVVAMVGTGVAAWRKRPNGNRSPAEVMLKEAGTIEIESLE